MLVQRPPHERRKLVQKLVQDEMQHETNVLTVFPFVQNSRQCIVCCILIKDRN